MNDARDFLSDVMARKRARVEAARRARPLEELEARALETRERARPRALSAALAGDGVHIIAEVKRASPSKGIIREDVDPARLAAEYEAGGAAAVSVLTEEDAFLGSLGDLRAVRGAVALPVLRKDFLFDEYQLYEAAEAGADALLLIVAALDDGRLEALRALAEERLRMDALVEVHTSEEMRRALACGASLVGVNNRDLRTFEVSLETSAALAGEAPPGVLLVAESGLRTRSDVLRLRAAGYKGFLVGETLMRAERPAEALRELLT